MPVGAHLCVRPDYRRPAQPGRTHRSAPTVHRKPVGAHFKNPPSSVTASPCHLPPWRGKAFGRSKAVPTAETGPGALAEKTQAQLWNRTSRNFYTPRAQWPGKNRTQALRFCTPEGFCPLQGITPVMGSGADSPCQGEMSRSDREGRVGDYEHEVLIGAVPGGVLVPLPPWAKELAARRRRNPPAGNHWDGAPRSSRPPEEKKLQGWWGRAP